MSPAAGIAAGADVLRPSLVLDSACLLLVPCASSDAEVRRRRRLTMRFAALAGAMVSPRWNSAVTHAVFTSVPVASDELSELKRAELRGVTFVDFEWVRQSALAIKMLSAGDFPPPTWETATAKGAMDNDGSSEHSRPSVAESRVFQGVRLALGPLAMNLPDACPSITAKVCAGRGKVLAHDATGLVTTGVPTHVVCPFGLSAGALSLIKRMREKNPRLELVTAYWIEQCTLEKQLLAVSSCALFVAREFELPLKSFSDKRVTIAMSGFMGKRPDPDRNRRRDVLSKLAVLLGAEYSERMQRNVSTHLIVESANVTGSEKIKRALQWRIPVISEKWLVACAATGTMVSTEPYFVAEPPKEESVHDNLLSGSKGTVTPTRSAQKRRSNSVSGDPAENSARRKSARKHVIRSSSSDAASAEALLKRVAANLHKISDVTAVAARPADSSERGHPGDDGGDPTAAGSVRQQQQTRRTRVPAGSSEISSARDDFLGGRQRSGADLGGVSAHPVAPTSDWSLEATQSQMIVHKDLTPPPITIVAPKPVPKLRMMPSRAAARSRGIP
jgi:twin BRCT domain